MRTRVIPGAGSAVEKTALWVPPAVQGLLIKGLSQRMGSLARSSERG